MTAFKQVMLLMTKKFMTTWKLTSAAKVGIALKIISTAHPVAHTEISSSSVAATYLSIAASI